MKFQALDCSLLAQHSASRIEGKTNIKHQLRCWTATSFVIEIFQLQIEFRELFSRDEQLNESSGMSEVVFLFLGEGEVHGILLKLELINGSAITRSNNSRRS